MADTSAPHPTPSSPGTDTSSTSSWPATEFGTSEVGDATPAAGTDKADDPAPLAPSATQDPATTKDELAPDSDEEEEEKLQQQTPSDAKDDAREGDSLEDGTAIEEKDKPASPTAAPDESAPRPAFLLTRPTMGGTNELVTITQPSTPTAGSYSEDDDNPATANLKPSIQIKTFLPETKTFFASPTSASEVIGSAASPLTSAFFASDFTAGMRSPPRAGPAFLVELPSDADTEVDIRHTPRTTVTHDKPATRPSSTKPSPSPERPASGTKSRSHSPAHREVRDRASPPSSHGRRSRSRSPQVLPSIQRHDLGDSDSLSDLDSQRVPFVQPRTVVSSAVPFLVRTEAVNAQHQARNFERDRSELPREDPQSREEHLHEEHLRRERPRDERLRQTRLHEHRPREDRPREDRPRADRPRESRPREAHVRNDRPPEAFPSDDRPREGPREGRPRADGQREDGPPALVRLLETVKRALRHDPAAYYVLKGVLSEYEELTRAPPPIDSRREGNEPRRAETHEESELWKIRRRGKRGKRVPIVGESDTEVDRGERVRAPETGGKIPRFDRDPTAKFRKHPFAPDPPRRDSPTPPCYPPHLSSPRSSRSAAAAGGGVDVVRPIPIYPPSRTRDFSPRTAETLTLAQAAKLAAGLGDEQQADKLRRSGLSGREKVTRLEGRDESLCGREERRDRERERERERKEEESRNERLRRHSFDSVVDYKPASDEAPTGPAGGKVKKPKSGHKVDVEIDVNVEHREGVPPLSTTKSRGPSEEREPAFSIFRWHKVPPSKGGRAGPPIINIDLVDKPNTRDAKDKGKGKAREALYESPSTRAAPQAASHFRRDAQSASASSARYASQQGRDDQLGIHFDDFA
ncbi:hypothetical protein JCM3770_006460 [Rhodotorula araucariae]